MHRFTAALLAGTCCAAAAPAAQAAGSWTLSATSPTGTYAPTFTGNGTLGVRVPPAGQGYDLGQSYGQSGVPSDAELAGFYAQAPGQVQQRANLPMWSTLQFTPGGAPGAGTATISGWHQTLDLQTGVITTTMRETTGSGQASDLTYQVLTDRARPDVGLVRLILTPHWSGAATVTDEIDGTPANLTTQVATGSATGARRDWVEIATQGTGITATLSSQLETSANVVPSAAPPVTGLASQSVAQAITFPVTSGQTYTLTKYVGVVDSQSASDTVGAAQSAAQSAATAGWSALVNANDAAWSALWKDRIDVLGDSSLATIVNASQFYLWSSTAPGVDWSISPAGLSSNGYNGHIFWDAETWMFPSLLAQHPDLAAGMTAYRFNRLGAAEQHATATGYRGARFPWESALDGTEQIPPPVSTNSEGLYEQHITADVALAQWQYFLATGDRRWLAQRGWPVLRQAATFWASRVTRGANGRYHIDGVTGPDEENPDVNDEVYTNVGAMRTLQDAVAAARVLRVPAPAAWTRMASGLVVPVSRRLGPLVHPEFSGYAGQLVKQADVTLIQYPWAFPMSRAVATADIDFYVPRTDPQGPSMSDAVNEIDTSALGTPGCSAFVDTERSYQPFIRDPFDQFSETRSGGAFTFMTGIGGFLQEFLYGYSGLRWGATSVSLDPSLNAQLPGIVLRGLSWHGRRFTVAIGLRRTTVTVQSGAPLPVSTPAGLHLVRRGAPLHLATRRPDLAASTDPLRCGAASASSTQTGAPPLAAVDGSPATYWAPAALPATLTVALRRATRLRTVTVLWGHQWPAVVTPNVPPKPGPVITLRPTGYQLLGSTGGTTWQVLATVGARSGDRDVLHFSARRLRALRLRISGSTVPLLQEVTAG